MSISEKIKAINNKIWQNKAQYDLVRQKKDLLEKAAAMKIIEHSKSKNRHLQRNRTKN